MEKKPGEEGYVDPADAGKKADAPLLYDEEGKPIEGALPPEEAKKLQTELEENRKQLAQLANKDFNFKKMRDMTAAELSKLSAQERSLIERQEQFEERLNKDTTVRRETTVGDAIDLLCGDNDEIKEKVKVALKDFDSVMNKDDKRSVHDYVKKAYQLATGKQPVAPNPIFAAHQQYGNPGLGKNQDASGLSPDQKDLGAKLGVTADDLKNYKPSFKTTDYN